MTTLFIADLHLSEQEPTITVGFLDFLKREAVHADALYILGDLFEAWIGDDDPNPLHAQVAQALAELHQHHVPCYFIHGNRDFLISHCFAEQSKMILLPEEQVIDVYGEKTLILHGDTLCTDDPGYLRFRKYIHSAVIQKLYLTLPLCIRQKIATRLRNKSQTTNRTKPSVMMDVSPLAVIGKLKQYQVFQIIHGHTHHPAIHDMTIKGRLSQRIVLGSWHDSGSVLRIKPNYSIELATFPL
ncbi:UDP-2,3-diacylglucosamine diphosphatase [Budvicia diplopodorum]|uniref:UDP-2,3-diacylglucosamine diphosphatase n=1 Tax=Budvicia diplopodorum TaxID=1119056 RepID=UPI001356C526|nr:UDP-2,3-diacylglucosamine diphosphatase [Budvicia diplopodorum]